MLDPLETHTCLLIAEYLKSKGLIKTLEQFEQETGRSLIHNIDKLDESLSSIVSDRVSFLKLKKKYSEDESAKIHTPQQLALIRRHNLDLPNWTPGAPKDKSVLEIPGNTKNLIIHSSFWKSKQRNAGIFLNSSKQLFVVDLDTHQLVLSKANHHGTTNVKLAIGVPQTDILLTFGMNGTMYVNKVADTLKVLAQHDLHARLITNAKYLKINETSGYICSIGWDLHVKATKIDLDEFRITPVGQYKLMTNATCLECFWYADRPFVAVGRLETSTLSLMLLDSSRLVELAKIPLNDSEFSNHSFQPMDMLEFTSGDSQLLCVATDHVPYMRIITAIVPDLTQLIHDSTELADSPAQLFTSSVPILRDIIVSNLNTMSPQDKYSSAQMLKRPVNGVWIVGDDGIVRGMDLKTGEIVRSEKMQDGRIKSAFIGATTAQPEILITCGAVDRNISVFQ